MRGSGWAAGAPTADSLAQGAYYEPTIVDRVDATSPVFREEIFGPVLSVTSFLTEEEAIQLVNATEYGLAQAMWTSSLGRALHVSRRLEAGTVWVNTTSDGAPSLAFGGTKTSGFGREAGLEGLEEFTEYRTVQFRGRRRPDLFTL